MLSEVVHKMKRCPKCDTIKEAAEFYRHSKRKDGLSGYCKICSRALCKAHHDKSPTRFTSGVLKPRGSAIKADIRRAAIVKYGIAVVEVMDVKTYRDPDETEYIDSVFGGGCYTE